MDLFGVARTMIGVGLVIVVLAYYAASLVAPVSVFEGVEKVATK